MIHRPVAEPELHDLFDPDVMGEEWPEICGCLNCARTGQTLTPLQVAQLYEVLRAEGRDPGREIMLATIRTFHPEMLGRTIRKPTWRDRISNFGQFVWYCLGY